MAYKGYSFKNAAGTASAFWDSLLLFLVEIGWVLHDDISSIMKVYKSNGEAGDEPYVYVLFELKTAAPAHVSARLYQYWDATSHAGFMEQTGAGTANNRTTVFNNTQDCILSGDKDMLFILSAAEGGNYPICITAMQIKEAIINADGTAGTAATLSVASTAGMYVGKQMQILDSGTKGREPVCIQEIVNGSTIIVNKLSQDYGTGAKIGVPACTFGMGYLTGGRHYPLNTMYDSGTSATSYFNTISLLSATTVTAKNFSKKYTSSPLVFYESATTRGNVYGFIYKNHIMAKYFSSVWDAGIYNSSGEYGTSATASTTTANSLIETGRSWATDQHANRMVLITAGTGIGQAKKITGNDATSLTIDGTWGTSFGTSRYQICDELYRVQNYGLYFGCALKITDTTAPAVS